MKVTEQRVNYNLPMSGEKMLKHIELCGRTCYQSHANNNNDMEITKKFVKRLIESKHESVLEHCSFTATFTMSRASSHQLVRSRLSSYSQESQRYCKYNDDVIFIRPDWVDFKATEIEYFRNSDDIINKGFDTKTVAWLLAMIEAEENYNVLIDEGCSAEDAREVLPNSCKTEVVMTCNLRQWRTVFKQRCDKHAQEAIRTLMRRLVDSVKLHVPIVFDDITWND